MPGEAKCAHPDYTECIWQFSKVACGEGKHTEFLMMKCKECGMAVPFPEENFRLITKEAREWVISELHGFDALLAPDF